MTPLETGLAIYFGIGLLIWIIHLFFMLIEAAQKNVSITWSLKGTALFLLFWPLFVIAAIYVFFSK